MKNIAIVMPSYKPVPDVRGGGIEHLVTNIITDNEQVNRFHIDLYTIDDVRLTKYNFSNTVLYKIRKNRLKIIIEKIINRILFYLNIEFVFDWYNYSVKHKIKNKKYDFIIVENNMYLYKILYCVVNSKFIFHLHNDIDNRNKPYSLCKFISNTASQVITCSEFLKERFYSITKCNQIAVLNNCVDFKIFTYSDMDRINLRKKYKLDKNDVVFLYIGRISEDKGIIPLIDSFELIKNKNFKLFIIGDKENGDHHTISMFNNLIESSVKSKYLGKIFNKDLYKFISMADSVVIPTIVEEAFGLVAIEAMSCGKPVIVANSGALTELVDHKCGFIFDKEQFAESFIDVVSEINDIAQLQEMGKNALKKVRNNPSYDSEKYFDNFRKILDNIR